MGQTADNWTVGGDVNAAGGYRQLVVFSQPDCTSGQTDVQLFYGSGNDMAIIDIPMTRAGSITGISVYSESARTAGTCTVGATINGTEIANTVSLDGTNTQTATATYAKDAFTFTAGQRIGAEVTTDGGWTTAAGTPSLTVAIEVEL